jgi:hypothetical protein
MNITGVIGESVQSIVSSISIPLVFLVFLIFIQLPLAIISLVDTIDEVELIVVVSSCIYLFSTAASIICYICIFFPVFLNSQQKIHIVFVLFSIFYVIGNIFSFLQYVGKPSVDGMLLHSSGSSNILLPIYPIISIIFAPIIIQSLCRDIHVYLLTVIWILSISVLVVAAIFTYESDTILTNICTLIYYILLSNIALLSPRSNYKLVSISHMDDHSRYSSNSNSNSNSDSNISNASSNQQREQWKEETEREMKHMIANVAHDLKTVRFFNQNDITY